MTRIELGLVLASIITARADIDQPVNPVLRVSLR
jgi:hypothetical protein